jgi:glycine/D-amino acid oxidase-like deaminating enzyme
MAHLYRSDVLILGGGIAGLWALHRLRREGFKAALVESDELGAGQTLASQGMIHGGQKYRGGRTEGDVARMPPIWDACLAGTGEVDLRGTQTLSEVQHVWTPPGLLWNLVGRIGSWLTRRPMTPLEDKADWPEPLRADAGRVYRLDEKVLDVRSLLESLRKPVASSIYRGRLAGIALDGDRVASVEIEGPSGRIAVSAAFVVFCAGAGNEEAARLLGTPSPVSQRRPLAQILARPLPAPLYGHCFGTDRDTPRLTVTSHAQADGSFVWYLGGAVAEEGARSSDLEAVGNCRREVGKLLPSMPWKNVEWSAFRIDRAEPHAGGKRPPGAACTVRANACLAWPVKMTLAPELAARIRSALEAAGVKPGTEEAALPLPPPEVGKYPWQRAVTWERIGTHEEAAAGRDRA